MAEGVRASGGPEELLRGALEKIVFFECRVSQLEAELQASRVVATREKEASAHSRGRELELETLLAKARSELGATASRSAELEERVRLLEAERERFLSVLVERARLAGAPGDGEGEAPGEQADLAGFIAELRSDIARLEIWKAAAQKAGLSVEDGAGSAAAERSVPVPPFSQMAARFEDTGRLGVARREAARMKDQLATRAERSLYETSMDDLAAADSGRRRRAADCLRALGSRAAAPLVAAAIGRERDPDVKGALLAALAALGEKSTADIAAREAQDPRPAVRAAALEALASLARDRAEPVLAGALGDPSPVVRRRAVLLLGFVPGAGADDALGSALADRHPSVARAAALALSGRPSARAQSALAKSLDHSEPGVRRCAADAVARWSGERVDPGSSTAERRRAARRIAEKLAALDEGALRDAVVRAPVRMATATAAPTKIATKTATAVIPPAPSVGRAAPGVEGPPDRPSEPSRPSTARSLPTAPAFPDGGRCARGERVHGTAVAVAETPASEPGPLGVVLVGEVRASLRGRTAEELSQLAQAEPAAVTAELRALVALGTLSQRGSRFFMS